jgi:flagellar biosynthesis protein FlhB
MDLGYALIICVQWAVIAYLLHHLIPHWKWVKKVHMMKTVVRKNTKRGRGRPSKNDELKITAEVARRLQEEAEKGETRLPDGVVPY